MLRKANSGILILRKICPDIFSSMQRETNDIMSIHIMTLCLLSQGSPTVICELDNVCIQIWLDLQGHLLNCTSAWKIYKFHIRIILSTFSWNLLKRSRWDLLSVFPLGNRVLYYSPYFPSLFQHMHTFSPC